jgi:hypothetical protein
MNGFNGLDVTDCPAFSTETETSSLTIPDRIKLPDEIPCRIIEIETTIMVTITIRDNRIKTILSQVCTAYRAGWMQHYTTGQSRNQLAQGHVLNQPSFAAQPEARQLPRQWPSLRRFDRSQDWDSL